MFMGLLSKFWAKKVEVLPRYVVRLSVRGPTGDMRHQFVTFEASSSEAAIQHALRRATHQNVLRWKLLDSEKREIATGFGGRVTAQRASDSDIATVAEREAV
jgi:hypothetical protein